MRAEPEKKDKPSRAAPAWLLHPFALAVYPVLALYAANQERFPVEVVLWPAGLSLGAAVSSVLLLAWPLGWHKAGLCCSLGLLVFYSYGHLAEALAGATGLGFFRGWAHLGLWALLLAAACFWIARSRRPLGTLTRVFNLAALCLLAFPVVEIGARALLKPEGEQDLPALQGGELRPASRPNIYYIILDGYARSDVLGEVFGLSNRRFLDELEKRGFAIAERARSNYCQTDLSLSSSLNMAYLDELIPKSLAPSADRSVTRRLIRQSRVFRALRELGYRLVAFSTGFHATELDDFDVLLQPSGVFSEFTTGLLRTTPAAPLLELLSGQEIQWWQDEDLKARLETARAHPRDRVYFDQHRERIRFALARLPATASMDGPVFVMAHLLCPHPPFVFGPDGEARTPRHIYCHEEARILMRSGDMSPEEYQQGYRDQVTFISKRVLEIVDGILSRSASPPVILLQADHGSGFMLNQESLEDTDLKERFSIFSAYYLPDGARRYVYPSISPVNSFRLVFKHYFGADLHRLADRSFYSTRARPYDFVEVTERIADGALAALRDVWAAEDGRFFVVGDAGTLSRYENGAWIHDRGVTRRDLRSVAGLSARRVWAVGASGSVLAWDGRAWKAEPSGVDVDLQAVWAPCPQEVWAVGDAGKALRYREGRWSAVETRISDRLWDVWGKGCDDVWLVGEAGRILHWDGRELRETASPAGSALRAVWGLTAGDVWAAGEGGLLLHFDGRAWSRVESPADRTLHGIWGSSADRLMAVGEGGCVLQREQGRWRRVPSSTARSLYGVFGLPGGAVLAVGDAATVIESQEPPVKGGDAREESRGR
ncbi:MAG: hypothetical protein JXR96_09615 [Deltaproteobacteria bacterium]|nr:hypothetical protein [Deltaproteobacteria bacterium]